MRYPVVIHKDRDSDYGVTVPDLPGCFPARDTADEALSNVIEAIECHIEGLLIDGQKIPQGRPIEHYRGKRKFSSGIWALVDVDLSKLSGKAKRVNITLPERILSQIDTFALQTGDTPVGVAGSCRAGVCQFTQRKGKANRVGAGSETAPPHRLACGFNRGRSSLAAARDEGGGAESPGSHLQ